MFKSQKKRVWRNLSIKCKTTNLWDSSPDILESGLSHIAKLQQNWESSTGWDWTPGSVAVVNARLPYINDTELACWHLSPCQRRLLRSYELSKNYEPIGRTCGSQTCSEPKFLRRGRSAATLGKSNSEESYRKTSNVGFRNCKLPNKYHPKWLEKKNRSRIQKDQLCFTLNIPELWENSSYSLLA